MTSTRGRDSEAGILFQFLVLVIALWTPGRSAFAQVAGSDAPPPVRTFIDTNGVNLIAGSLNFNDTQVSIGQPGQGGLGRIYFGGSVLGAPWARDNLAGTINSSGSTYTVSLGAASYTYLLSGSAFTSLQGDGSTLTKTNSTTYTWVRRDGTIGVFSTNLLGGLGSLANVARITSLTLPDGEVDTYTYTSHQWQIIPPTFSTGYRIDSITNNFGYQIKYLYQGNGTLNYSDFILSKVIAINNAVDYCAPTATSCTLTVTWPSISFNSSNTNIVTDELGRQTTYIPSTASTTQTLIRPSGLRIAVTFDSSSRVTQLSNGTGTWQYAYSTSGSTLTTTVTDPNTHTRVVVINTANVTVTSDTDGVGNKTSFAYDSSNRVQTITRQEGDTVGYTYDTRGNIMQIVNTGKDHASKITTSASFDVTCTAPAKCNYPNWTKDGKGFETDYTYNTSTGQPLSIIRPAGANGLRPETDFTYTNEYAWYKNSAGTIVQAASPVSLLTQISQCATAQTCAGTLNAAQSTFVYGTSGVANNRLLTSETQGAGDGSVAATTGLAYDGIGNLYTQTDPLTRVTRYRFDLARQLVGIVGPDPDGAGALHNRAVRITYECDATVKSGCDGLATKVERGTVLSEADSDWTAFALLGQRVITYDTVDRKATDIISSGSTYISASQFSYDTANRLTCRAQRMNPGALASLPASACSLGTQGLAGPDRITNLTYDNADKLLKTTIGYGTSVQADAETTTFGGDGEVFTKADAKGHLTTLIHDTFNRIYQVEFPTPSNGSISSTSDYEQYTYDNNGNITQNRRRDGTLVNYGYDALNLRTSGYNGSTFGYDNLGRMTSAAVTGNSESFGYDALNRQTSESISVGAINRKFDLAGNMTRLTYPSGYYVTYGYDAANEPTSLTDSNAVTLLQEVYDNLGRITSTTRAANGPSESRAYGPDLRLSTQQYSFAGTSSNVSYSYTWNLAGQPMSMTPNNSAYSNTTSPSATSYASDGQNRYTTVGGQTMSYDGRSNLTNDGTNSYTFDGLNRTTAVNGTPQSYDALDRYVTLIAGSTTIKFVYSGRQLIAVYDGSGNLLDTYVPSLGLDQTVLWYFGPSTAISNARWLVSNAFGSVVSAGSPTNGPGITTYDAYGSSGSSGLASQNGGMGYKGMIQLSAGVYDARARTYNATLGRFLQPDPGGYADGLNLYAFVHNSPLNGEDPTGFCDAEGTDENTLCTTTVTGSRPSPAPPPPAPDIQVPPLPDLQLPPFPNFANAGSNLNPCQFRQGGCGTVQPPPLPCYSSVANNPHSAGNAKTGLLVGGVVFGIGALVVNIVGFPEAEAVEGVIVLSGGGTVATVVTADSGIGTVLGGLSAVGDSSLVAANAAGYGMALGGVASTMVTPPTCAGAGH